MRCKSCDYRLWNLRSRNCPECGASFRPSDFEFAINSVQFCCPHCGQDYYGTGERGHLRPFEFDCVRCRQRINMDEMVLLPTRGVEEERTQVEMMPWFDEKRGAFRRWTGTLLMALTRPGEMLRMTNLESSAGAMWKFYLVTMLASTLGVAGLVCLMPMIAFGVAGRSGGGAAAMGGAAAIVLYLVFVVAILGLLWSLVAHSVLRMTGPTAGGLLRTQQAIYYSSGANIIMVIPCLGPYISWIWWLISAVAAMREAQRVSTSRAILAVGGPIFLLIGGGVSLYVWFLSSMLSRIPTAYSGGASSFGRTNTLAMAIGSYANDHNGAGPAHPAALIADDNLITASDFVAITQGDPNSLFVGTTPLGDFETLDDKARQIILSRATSSQATPAFGFGDFIFCYGGVDLTKAPKGVWVVFTAPAAWPGYSYSGDTQGAGEWIEANTIDGQPLMFFGSGVQTAITAQNSLRANAGLPPIPLSFITPTTSNPASEPAGEAEAP